MATNPAASTLSRAQVQTAFGKLSPHLGAAAKELVTRLLQCLEDDGSCAVKTLHERLFPMAETKGASAQLSKLLGSVTDAAAKSGVVIEPVYEGSKQGGVAKRRLRFHGPRPALRADTEGLNAIPAGQLVTGQMGLPLVSERRIALVTFNDHEFKAVKQAFAGSKAIEPQQENGVPVFPLGSHGGLQIFLRHSAQGNRQSQRTAADLYQALEPLAVVAVGIAFGADGAKQQLGDVLVSSFVCDYELAKVHAGGRITLRGARPPASRRWLEAARQVDQSQRHGDQAGTWPELRIGGLLSGEKLVDDIDYRDNLKAMAGQDDIVGGEMEAAGLFSALDGRGVDWIVIKAICDFADGQKSQEKERRQKDAAENAARVVKTIIDSGLVSYPEPTERPAPQPTKRHLRAMLGDAEGCLPPVRGQVGHEVDLETLAQEQRERRPTAVVLDDILAWATEPQARPLYALLGEYGMGKTTTCQSAALQLRQRREAGEAVPLALYFDLRKVERLVAASTDSAGRVPTLREAIEDCLRHGYLHEGGEAPRYEDLLAEIDQSAVVFFDGLDEVLSRLSDRQGLTFTANLLKVRPEAEQRGAQPPRVLLSCRTQFFRNLAEQHNHLTGEHRGAQPASQYRAMALLPFEDEQILAYLRGAFPGTDPQSLLDRIAEVHDLRELAQRPFTLKLVTRFIPRLEQWRAEGRTVTGVTLYREVAREWLIRDKEKQSFQPEDKEQLAADLAAYLWREKRRGMAARELESWLGGWLSVQDPHADFQRKPRDLLQEDLRNSTFLKRVDGNDAQESRFEFAHTSLQEFFLADHLLRALKRANAGDDSARDAWALPRPSDETLDFLGQMLAETPALVSALTRWRVPYQAGASELQLAYALRAHSRAWPAPSLDGMALAGADLNDWHFGANDEEPGPGRALLNMRGIDFSGARLRGASFWQVDLSGCNFTNAALTQAEFLNCQVARAEWLGAEVAGCVFRPVGDAPGALSRPSATATARLALASGHSSGVNACAMSPDGLWLVSASDDGTLRLWDTTSGDLLDSFVGHQGPVRACAFSPDGRWLASASDDRTLRLWDAASGDLLRSFGGHQGSVLACAFSPNGHWLASASGDRMLHLWDVASGDLLRSFQGHQGSVLACAFSPDGRWLASASDDGTLRLWDAASGDLLRSFEGHQDSINACAFSPDGRWLASASDDRTLRLWDASSGDLLHSFEGHQGSVLACAFSPDGRWLAASDDRTLRLWDAASGDLLRSFEGHQHWIRACAFSPDGRWLASASSDRTLRLWDAASSDLLRSFEGRQRSVRACTFSPDGRWLASASDDRTLRLWGVASGDLLRSFEGHQDWARACAFSPDGRWLASASDDRTLRLWDVASGDLLRSFEGHQHWIHACAFSCDGRWLASASSDRTLRLWDATSGDLLRSFEGHQSWVLACAFSPDGRWLASASGDRMLRLWDAASGDLLRSFDGHHGWVRACAFSPDGRWLASASDDRTLRLWDAASGDLLRSFGGHQGSVLACAFSPNGHWLASASGDRMLHLWDVASGDLLRSFQGHQGSVLACAFSPDGRWLASASDDGTLRLWETASGALFRNHLHVDKGAAAWLPQDNRLLYANGSTWRYLRWFGNDPVTGHPATWPLENPPPGVTVDVRPWRTAA